MAIFHSILKNCKAKSCITRYDDIALEPFFFKFDKTSDINERTVGTSWEPSMNSRKFYSLLAFLPPDPQLEAVRH